MNKLPDILPPFSEDDRMLSGLVYPLWPFVSPLILYTFKREEPYVHFHALQALALGGVSIAASLLLGMLTILIMWLLPSWSIAISGILGLAVFVTVTFVLFTYMAFILYVAWQAGSGVFLRLPFIGRWAEEKMQNSLGITFDDYSTKMIGERREVNIQPFHYDESLDNFQNAEENLAASYERGTLEEDFDADYTFEYSKQSSQDISQYTATTQGKPQVAAPAAVPPTPSKPDDSFRSLADTLLPHNAPPKRPEIKWNSDFSAPSRPVTPPPAARHSAPVPQRPASASPQRPLQRPVTAPRPHAAPAFPNLDAPAPQAPVRRPAAATDDNFRPGLVGNKTNSFRFDNLDESAPSPAAPPRRLPPADQNGGNGQVDGFQAWH